MVRHIIGKSLKKAMNLIFIMSIGIPFVVSIIIHGPLIEQLILNNYRDTTRLTMQSMANHIDSYIHSYENFFFQYLFDEKIAKFYSYVDNHEITLKDRAAFYEYFKISTKYRDAVIKYMSTGNDYLKQIYFIPEHANTNKVFSLNKSNNSVEILDIEDAGLADMLQEVSEISLSQIIISKNIRYPESEETVYTMARQINQIEQAKRRGYVFLDISQDMFDEIVSNFNIEKNAGVIISYPNTEEAYTSSEKIERYFHMIENKESVRNGDSIKIDNEVYYVSSALSKSGFYIDYMIPKSIITDKANQLYFIFICVWISALLIAFILYTRLFKKISFATTRIMNYIDNYQLDRNENGVEEIFLSGIIEIDNISNALEDMNERIGTLVEEKYILKLNQQAAEYKAMQTEINPHFLNNVLSSLMALNRLEDRKALETAILNLSNMFRYTCEHGYDSCIAQECCFIESYLMLEKLRFENRLDYEIEVEPETEKLVMPKLLIQPIVENAMKHGFSDESNMMLLIRVVKISEKGKFFVWISVANNGYPIDKEKMKESDGVGINNVKERLGIVYPNSFMWYSSDSVFCTICNMLIMVEE